MITFPLKLSIFELFPAQIREIQRMTWPKAMDSEWGEIANVFGGHFWELNGPNGTEVVF